MPIVPSSLRISSPRTWPWWLWVEHGLLLGILSWKALKCLGYLRNGPIRPSAEQQLKLLHRTIPPSSAGRSSEATEYFLDELSQLIQAALSKVKELSGPPDVLTWPNVKPAPSASMDMAAVQAGEAAAFHDGRGSIYKFKLAEGVYVNMYYTKAGYRRSGDLHDCNQYDVVLQGRTRLRMIDTRSGAEVVQEVGANDFIVIPARTPHMFEFTEDTFLLEWWDDTFKAWYYQPYRDVIDQGLPLERTEAADFSVTQPVRQAV